MNIVLVITDSGGKNVVFTTDALQSHSMDDAAKLVVQGMIGNIHVVQTGAGSYLRANPNAVEKDNLDVLSISSYKLFASLDNISVVMPLPGFRLYWKLYQAYLKGRKREGATIVRIEGRPRTTVEHVMEKLSPHRTLVFDAAEHFSIDPYLLGGIIIDEIARANVIEEISDVLLLSFVGWNSSAGVAQVKMETARGLIRQGYYNPNPRDGKLSKKNIGTVPRAYLYKYVVQPKHSIFFAAAHVRALIDRWLPFVDISDRPDIIGTLYSLKRDPHPNPQPNDRGRQIAGKFYRLAKRILKSS